MGTSRHGPLMPRATAVWLIENTALTFEQIAGSCGLHPLEVQVLADDNSPNAIKGYDPVSSHQLTQGEIERCIQDTRALLCFQSTEEIAPSKKSRGGRYVSHAKRSRRPDVIAWIIKHCPGVTDQQISKLLHTTLKTVQAVRHRTHVNAANIKPEHPVLLGFCSEEELAELIQQGEQ